MKIQNFKILSLILGIVLVSSLGANFILLKKNTPEENPNNIQASLETSIAQTAETIEKVSANDIYPLFECACCGKSIDQCSCGMAKERKNYIDVVIEIGENISKDEIILVYVKKYGLDSFVDKEKQNEFQEKLVEDAPENRPIISLNSDVYDFGDISQKKETATTFFEIENKGKSDLVINRLDSSCGCTSASIVYQGEEGPVFTMPGHGKENPTDWQVVIPPGEKAQLKVYYDPNVHPDFRGAATRTVSVYSNDPIDFQKKVQIELNQVP